MRAWETFESRVYRTPALSLRRYFPIQVVSPDGLRTWVAWDVKQRESAWSCVGFLDAALSCRMLEAER